MNINFLGEIPIVQSIREAGDAGRPAILQKETVQAKAMKAFVKNVISTVEKKATKVESV